MPKKESVSIQSLCFAGIFAAVTAVLAQISIPMPFGVPFSLQNFAIGLGGVVLGPRWGAVAALVYLLLGATGVPVFAGLMGGLHRLVGPTGGFLLSYPLLAWLAGKGAAAPRRRTRILFLLLAVTANDLCGALMYSLQTGSGMAVALTACVLPFLPADLLKMAAAHALGKKVRARIPTAR